MADIADATIAASASNTRPFSVLEPSRPSLWSRIAFGFILFLSIGMNFYQLGENGYGNLYYAAGVRSMVDNWHNFFFVSYDPGGFVTIDKPAFGFWLQALSARIFGFTPFSIFLPQALCGVLAVFLLYFLVRRHFGIVAGLVAALALAVSPISVVTDRNNTIDGTLALLLLLAAWTLILAAESGKLRWLLLSGFIVGIGFNVKMSEAYLVVPALGLTYLLCAPRKLWIRIVHLVLALVVLLVISLSWATAVDQVPVSQRPYVGSTKDNSELSLAFGYNGLARLRLNGGNPTTPATQSTSHSDTHGADQPSSNDTFSLVGNIHPARLFETAYGGQIAWLLPFALFAIIALAWQRRFNFQRDRQQMGLILWGVWLLTMATFFTLDASFHQYYMAVMAPSICAMVGIGLSLMWWDYRCGNWRGWLLLVALVVTALVQLYMLTSFPFWTSTLVPVIAIPIVLVVVVLLLFRLLVRLDTPSLAARAAHITLALGLFVLLIAPTIWSGYSVLVNTESSFPTAGPNPGKTLTTGTVSAGPNSFTAKLFQSNGGTGLTLQRELYMISYLEKQQGTTQYLLAVPSSGAASPIILYTNRPVMTLGGYGGGDPILTIRQLQVLIANNTIRYFLLTPGHTTQHGHTSTSKGARDDAFAGVTRTVSQPTTVSGWVRAHCSVVSSRYWQGITQKSKGTAGTGMQLYDCARAITPSS